MPLAFMPTVSQKPAVNKRKSVEPNYALIVLIRFEKFLMKER